MFWVLASQPASDHKVLHTSLCPEISIVWIPYPFSSQLHPYNYSPMVLHPAVDGSFLMNIIFQCSRIITIPYPNNLGRGHPPAPTQRGSGPHHQSIHAPTSRVNGGKRGVAPGSYSKSGAMGSYFPPKWEAWRPLGCRARAASLPPHLPLC